MGTNYYANLPDGTEVHLGKRSSGWVFIFHATPEFGSVSELTGWLENTPATLVDEYGRETDPVSFMQMATSWWQPDGHRQHNCPCGPNPSIHGRSFPRTDDYQDGPHDWVPGEFG